MGHRSGEESAPAMDGRALLRETLFALLGHLGDVFERTDTSLRVQRDSAAHRAVSTLARESIERIARLGFYYTECVEFTLHVRAQAAKSFAHTVPLVSSTVAGVDGGGSARPLPCGSTARASLYAQALAAAVEVELDVYREAVLQAERELLDRNSTLTVSALHRRLAVWTVRLPVFHRICVSVRDHGRRGASLLDMIRSESLCGVPEIEAPVARILGRCHRVLAQQLTAWLAYGLVIDPHDEFFVAPLEAEVLDTTLTSGSSIVGTPLVTPARTPHTPAASARHSQGGTSSTPLSAARAAKYSHRWSRWTEQQDLLRTSREFILDHTRLPSYIPRRVAEDVVFAGRAIRTLSRVTDEQRSDFVSRIESLDVESGLDLLQLESVAHTIRSELAHMLWEVVVREANLPVALRNIHDSFLLGHGELYQLFLYEAAPLFSAPVGKNATREARECFKRALAQLPDSDRVDFWSTVKLSMSATSSASLLGSGGDGSDQFSGVNERFQSVTPTLLNRWALLSLRHEPAAPLHLVFTPKVMHRYATVFQDLLWSKYVQFRVHQLWKVLHAHETVQRFVAHDRNVEAATSALDDDPRQRAQFDWLHPARLVRAQLAFFLDQWQYYLRVDVLATLQRRLFEVLEQSRDFERVLDAHNEFLESLVDSFFLRQPQMSRALRQIFDLALRVCERFAFGMSRVSSDESTSIEDDRAVGGVQDVTLAEVRSIQAEFGRLLSLLYALLVSVKSSRASPFVAQLLLRLDFNRFFTHARQAE